MLLAFALVAASVVCHATWNLMAKRVARAAESGREAGAGGALFVAVWSVAAAVLWAPLGLWALISAWDRLDGRALIFIGGALVLHTSYYLILQRGYQLGDLSVVYPIARGLAPVLTCLVAVPFFGEDPGLLGWAGTMILAVSVAVLGKPRIAAWQPVMYAGLVGVLISAYTLWDKAAVALLPPILINWATDTGRAVLFAPWLYRRRAEALSLWREHRVHIVGTAVCSPGAYILVLTALTMAPVTLIAPLREVSVLLVVFLGAKLLGEHDMWRRLTAALGVVAGAVGVMLGRS